MKKLLLIGVLILLCSSIFSLDFSTGEDKGKITIFRSGTITGMGVAYEVMINQSVMVKVKRKDIVEITLNPGVYLIHIQVEKVLGYHDPKLGVFKLEVTAGEESIYKISPGSTYLTAPGKEFYFEKVDEINDDISREYIDKINWTRGDE